MTDPTRREVVRQLIAKWRTTANFHATHLDSAHPMDAATLVRGFADELEAALGEPSPTKIQSDCNGNSASGDSQGQSPVARPVCSLRHGSL